MWIKKLDERAIIPRRQSEGAAGFDLHALNGGIVDPGKTLAVATGIALEMPKNGMYCQIASRSGLAMKNSIVAIGGVIDQDYRGEIKVLLHNMGSTAFGFAGGDRIAQFVPLKLAACDALEEIQDLSETARGANGFGSTSL
jgi:dUTP pyrophosphatase